MASVTSTGQIESHNVSDPHQPHEASTHTEGHHVVPLSVHGRVFAALMVLLIITLAAAAVDFHKVLGPSFGWLNISIAVFIAVVKAALVILYFMHVRYSSRMTWVFAGAAFVFVGIMFGLTLSDYFTRDWLEDGKTPQIYTIDEMRLRGDEGGGQGRMTNPSANMGASHGSEH